MSISHRNHLWSLAFESLDILWYFTMRNSEISRGIKSIDHSENKSKNYRSSQCWINIFKTNLRLLFFNPHLFSLYPFSWSPKRLWHRYQGATSGATTGATTTSGATTTTTSGATTTRGATTTTTSGAGAAHCGTGSTLSAPRPWTWPWTFPWIWPWIFRWTWTWSSVCASSRATGLCQAKLGAWKAWFSSKFETKTPFYRFFIALQSLSWFLKGI